ncbi:unnamed protein product [marine sediment metagenome]|uniref:Uncharacterized protein n=1 Tax=marine sediment metagenome TaxID=412755 RepID=X1GCN8_9ZZZZ
MDPSRYAPCVLSSSRDQRRKKETSAGEGIVLRGAEARLKNAGIMENTKKNLDESIGNT